ncbi:MAG: alkaline phosphatase family protein [Bacillota bacterium]|jgi:hypothetical protein
MKRPLVFAVFCLLLASLAVGNLLLLVQLQESLNQYMPDSARLTDMADIRPVSGESPAEAVVLVVVDGLRNDISQGLQSLNNMRNNGAYGTARAGQPSYSKPGYAVISSGAYQDDTGIVLNDDSGPLVIDTIFRSAERSGLTTSLVAHDWWVELNGEDVFASVYSYRDEESHDQEIDMKVCDNALRILGENQSNLLLVHFMLTDTAGHEEGGLSTKYLAAAQAIDGYICEIATAMDLVNETLIVTADHGHLGRNAGGGSGHGGWESEVITVPFLMLGAGVKPGKIPCSILQTDVAPTVAALLDIQVPSSATGTVLWDCLDVEEEYRDSFEAADKDRMDAALTRSATKAAVVSEGRRNRSFWVLGVVLAIGLTLVMVRPKANPAIVRLALLGSAVYLLTYWLTYKVAFGYVFSLSTFPNAEMLTIMRIVGLPAAVSLAVACLGLIWTAEWRATGCPAASIGAIVAGISVTLLAIVAASYVVNGLVVTWPLPDFRVGFYQLSAMLQLGVVGLTAWIPVAVAGVLARIWRKS